LEKKSIFSRLREEWKILKTLKNQHYDLVLNLTEGDRGAIVAKFSKAKIRVGWDPQNQGFLGKKHLYTHTVKSCGSPRHHVEKNLDALRKIGIFPLEEEKTLHFPESPKAKNFIDSLMKKHELIDHNFFVFHPTTRWRFKGWKIEFWQEVAKSLQKKGKKIVFVSGPDLIEKETVYSIIKDLDPSLTVDLSGKLSIQELGALFTRAEKVICLDSLAFHIASALKVPVIVLFGPSSDKIWGPWQNPYAKVLSKNFSCRPCSMDGCGGSKKSACLLELLPKDVLEEIEKK
jgi:heptosyltransferase-3